MSHSVGFFVAAETPLVVPIYSSQGSSPIFDRYGEEMHKLTNLNLFNLGLTSGSDAQKKLTTRRCVLLTLDANAACK